MWILKAYCFLAYIESNTGLAILNTPANHRLTPDLESVISFQLDAPCLTGASPENRPFSGRINQEQAELRGALRTIFPVKPEPLHLPAGQSSEPEPVTPLTLELVL